MPSRASQGSHTIVVDQEKSTQQGDKRSRWSVNRHHLPLKMFYFFFYGASGTFIPFITVYLKYLRMSASEAGLITGLSMLVAMLIRAAVGMVADKMNARKTALLICCLGFGAAFFTMWFVPRRVVIVDKTANSTADDPTQASPYNQQQLHSWVCFTNDGHEICRYPARMNYPSCITVEDQIPKKNSQYQPYSRTLIMDSGDYISEYVNAHKDGGHNVTDNSKMHLSDTNNEDRDHLYRTQRAPNEHKTFPCFFVNSERAKTNTANIGHNGLQNEYTAQRETQRTEAFHNFETVASPIESHADLTTPQRGGDEVSDAVSCLLNCTRLLVNGSDDESSDVITKQPISESAGSTRGPGGSVTADLTFTLSFLLLIIGKSLYSASTSLADAVAYTILGPYSLKWGQQRLWGTVGTGVTVLSITLANDSRQVESFTGLFIACIGLSILAVLVGFFKLRADKAPKNKTFFKDLVKLISSGSVRLFLIKLLFYGVMAGTVQNFTFWFLIDIGSAHITLGVCLLLYCISSVFMLRYSRLVLHKLGHVNVMYVTLLAYAIRYLVLSFLTNAWLVLPTEILHGVTYSLFWAAASSTASIVAPPGTQASSQGLAGAMYWDLGRGVGIIVSGQLLQLFGARWTFRAYSMVCVSVLPLLWMLDRMWSLPNSKAVILKVGNGQDGNVDAQLLRSASVNSFSLNNNTEKPSSIVEIRPAIKDDIENINSSKKELSITESGFVEGESKVNFFTGDLETVESQTCQENTRSGEHTSRVLSDFDNESSKKAKNSVSHNEMCAKEKFNGTETDGNVSKPDCHAVLTYIY